jgi:hypothetical protein
MKAIRCWTKDPSQPSAFKVGIFCTQTDVNSAIETQTEISWLHMFRCLDWGYVHFEEETITNRSEEMSTYLNQVRHAFKMPLLSTIHSYMWPAALNALT